MSLPASFWRPFLERAGVVILDGGLATELEWRGADLPDPLWSARLLIDQPDLIRAVHLDYFLAGADVGVSASYQASIDGFARRGLSADQAMDLMVRSVHLVQEARDQFWELADRPQRGWPLVAASIGPFGACLADGSEYRGDYGLTAAQLRDWHRPRWQALAQSGADLLAIETIPCLAEVEAVVALLKENPDISAWLSCCCRDDRSLCNGEPVGEMIALAETCPNLVAVGFNCTAPRWIEGLLRLAAPLTTRPLLAYPNSGDRWDAEGRDWRIESQPLDWSSAAPGWFQAGARLLGGCCRTTPETIRSLRQGLANRIKLSSSAPGDP